MRRVSRLRDGAYTLLFMLAVTAVFVSATSATYLATKERVDLNVAAFRRRAVLAAAGIEAASDAATVSALFERMVTERTAAGGSRYYLVTLDGGRAIVFVADAAGLWGTITAAVGLDERLDGTLRGISFISQNETPGLGARIDEPWFTAQFRMKRAPLTARPEGEATKPDEFDAITGATITSSAVRLLINRVVEDAPRLVRGASGN